jgi:hypothetical protein
VTETGYLTRKGLIPLKVGFLFDLRLIQPRNTTLLAGGRYQTEAFLGRRYGRNGFLYSEGVSYFRVKTYSPEGSLCLRALTSPFSMTNSKTKSENSLSWNLSPL